MNRTEKSVLFVHDRVGASLLEFLQCSYAEDIVAVVIKEPSRKNEKIRRILQEKAFPVDRIYIDGPSLFKQLALLSQNEGFGFVFLLWWPSIVSKDIISLPLFSTINTHPSYLPFCRGKDPNFWSIVEEVPFGVSLHEVTPGIDDGNIIAQKEIKKDWLDSGESLYCKGTQAMVELFREEYPKIRQNKQGSTPQKLSSGSFHFRNELKKESEIFLDKSYVARKLLNLLRAKTFDPHPACFFEADGKKYSIRVRIERAE